MAVTFVLKDKNKDTTYINVVVSFKGSKYKRTTGESVPPKKWNQKTLLCSEIGFTRGKAINKKLKEIYYACCKTCDRYVELVRIPTSIEYWADVDKLLKGEKFHSNIFFTDYFQTYIDRMSGVYSKSTLQAYVTTLHKLQQYEEKTKRRLSFGDIDIIWYNNFQKFIYAQDYAFNYFGALIKCVKVVFREARDSDHLHKLSHTSHKGFKAQQETSDSVYLSEEELLRIHRLEITKELLLEKFPDMDRRASSIERKLQSMEIVRAKFLIGAYTALRVSDFNRLESVNLADNNISIRTKKTGVRVTVPIHWIIRDIIDSGFDISTEISDQKLNKRIKEIAKMAEINDDVELVKNIGGNKIRKIYKKWELISTHTCRRSGATNMVKFGVPAIYVMKITGHASWKSFQKYIKISDKENANLIKGTGYFDKPVK